MFFFWFSVPFLKIIPSPHHTHTPLAKDKFSFPQAKTQKTPMLLLSPDQTLRHSALSKVSPIKIWAKNTPQQVLQNTAIQISIRSSFYTLSNQRWNPVYEQLYHLAAAINERTQANGTKLIPLQGKKSSSSSLLP